MASKLDNLGYIQTLPEGGPREFYTASLRFLEAHQCERVWVEGFSDQHRAWVGYFAHKGWRLRQMEDLRGHRLARLLMPAEWPEIFDSGYVAPATEVAITDEELEQPQREVRKSYAALRRMHDGPQGETWGIGRPHQAGAWDTFDDIPEARSDS